MHSEKLLALFLLFLFFYIEPSLSSPDFSLEFELHSLSVQDFIFLGDSHLQGRALVLTETVVPMPSSGGVFFAKPIRFLDPKSRKTKSFTTTFVFSTRNVPPLLDDSSRGDGFALLLSPNIHFVGSPGFMGLTDSIAAAKTKFVAVEFDIKKDSLFLDPDNNHVGLDISSLRSIQLETAHSVGIDLNSGQLITAWIEYRNEEKRLDVSLNDNSFKPDVPLLSVDIDLSEYIDEIMYVGFSSSTGGTIQVTRIENWEFSVLGLSSPPPPPPPAYIFRKPSESGRTHHPSVILGLSVAAAMTFGTILLIFSCIGVKKWKLRNRKSKSARYYVEIKKCKPSKEDAQQIRLSIQNTGKIVDSIDSNKGGGQFRTIMNLKSLNHPNLENVMNCLVRNDKVVTEHDSDAMISLEKVMFQEYKNGHPLKWHYRYKIAGGLADAITYLHQQCDFQVIHGDIRSSNVLLDEVYNPKLTNFGLVTPGDCQDCMPMHIAGIMGYAAPEYLQDGKATVATDVYSFGVVVLELACGRRSIESELGDDKILVDWVCNLHSEGKIMQAADKRLNDDFNKEEMRKLLLIGLSCANPDFAQRPTMIRVCQNLNNEAEPMVVPTVKPTLTFSNT